MATITPRTMLEALGYGTTTAEISRFQREHNGRGPKTRLLVSGQLDAATLEALELTYGSRELLALIGKGGVGW